MSYEIERKDLPEIPFIFQRRRITAAEIPDALAQMFGAVYQFATSRGLEFAGPPTARYPEMSPGGMTLEAGMPIAEAVEGDGEVQCGVLQGGANAVTIHKGPYDDLHLAHEAMEKWIATEGATPGGPPCEMYVTDPGEVPDPAEWLTEVRWPLT